MGCVLPWGVGSGDVVKAVHSCAFSFGFLLPQSLARAHVHQALVSLDAALALDRGSVAADGDLARWPCLNADVAKTACGAVRVYGLERARAAPAPGDVVAERVRLAGLLGRGQGRLARGGLGGADDGGLACVVWVDVVLVS